MSQTAVLMTRRVRWIRLSRAGLCADMIAGIDKACEYVNMFQREASAGPAPQGQTRVAQLFESPRSSRGGIPGNTSALSAPSARTATPRSQCVNSVFVNHPNETKSAWTHRKISAHKKPAFLTHGIFRRPEIRATLRKNSRFGCPLCSLAPFSPLRHGILGGGFGLAWRCAGPIG